jgi:hypothetical protein
MFLTFLALILQTICVGLCTCAFEGAAGAHAHAETSLQHCDALAPDTPSPHHQGPGAQGLAHHSMCPFNSVHFQAPPVDVPEVGAPERIVFVAAKSERAPLIVPERDRFPAGAPPCGPPAAA